MEELHGIIYLSAKPCFGQGKVREFYAGNPEWTLLERGAVLLQWSPDGKKILFGIASGEVHVFDNTGNFIVSLTDFGIVLCKTLTLTEAKTEDGKRKEKQKSEESTRGPKETINLRESERNGINSQKNPRSSDIYYVRLFFICLEKT